MSHINSSLGRSLALLIVVTLFFSPLLIVSAQDPPPEIPAVSRSLKNRLEPDIKFDEHSEDAPIEKLDPALREIAQTGGGELISVYVSVKTGADISDYLTDPIYRPEIFPGMQYVLGKTTESNLLKIAGLPGVISVIDGRLKERERPYDKESHSAPDQAILQQRIAELLANELTYQETETLTDDVGASGWFDVLDGHKSSEAWKKGFTGEGVILGVIDDGVDFAHPDLIGTSARVSDQGSPYFGWPMAYSQASTEYFVYDVFLGTSYIKDGATSSMWSDTSINAVPAGSTVNYQNY